ncbi:hypothetical protein M758_N016000 [Ceratodon purpureus]|nr:hypothetical protein M758_N016000 [Ceratodon purpureus]
MVRVQNALEPNWELLVSVVTLLRGSCYEESLMDRQNCDTVGELTSLKCCCSMSLCL